jgi:hypothetical protein
MGTHTSDTGPKNPKEPEHDQSCNFCCKNSEVRMFESLVNGKYSEEDVVKPLAPPN